MAIRKISNRSFLTLPVLLLVLLVAACQPQMPPLPTTPSTPAVRVAVLSPTSGELAPFGRQLRNGIQLAFDQANAHGNSFRLEWSLYHSDCTFEGGRQAARQALADGHTLLIGPICSEAAIAAAIEADGAGALLLAPTALHPLVTQNNQGSTRRTVFTMSYSPNLQGQAAARFAADRLKKKQAALIVPQNDLYATQLAEAFEQAFSGDIVANEIVLPGGADGPAMTDAIGQTGAGLVYFPANPQLANQIGPAVRLQGIELLGSDLWTDPQLDRARLNGSYLPVQFEAQENRSAVQQFVERYKSIYAVAPGPLAVLGYDAASVLVQAMQPTGGSDVESILQILVANNFEGVTGPIRFDAAHTALKPVPIDQIIDGQMRYQTTITP